MAAARTTQTSPFLLSLVSISLLLLQAISVVDCNKDQDSNDATDFIRTNCNATLYPDVCYSSLSRYANTIQQSPAKLARVAVAVSLSRARRIAAYITNLSRQPNSAAFDTETAAVLKDCSSTFGDAIDQMRRSNTEMIHLDLTSHSQESLRFQMSNVQTWMSAALTNEDTCTDEFGDLPDESVKSDVCERVVYGRKLTSNALAMVNRFVAATEADAPATTP
ncbi:pectinesterase inhibitor 7-like [Telopea speciosissima]|uniref:pectinesterase inhibitor 7-like n=1 Tax=Telopea speciosissima TaxID=54955 RepID=UPI001CC77631|nr:pectinesterase inhibitor 7-like [Telopea speciosissima]